MSGVENLTSLNFNDRVLTVVLDRPWAKPIVKDIAVNYARSVLRDPLFLANRQEYLRKWHILRRSLNDNRVRFPEDMVHEVIEKEIRAQARTSS